MTTTHSGETPAAGRSTCTPRWPWNRRDCGMNSRSASSKAASRPGFTRLRTVTVTAASSGMAVPPAGLAGAQWLVPRSVLVGRLHEPLRGRRLAVDHRVGVLDALPVRPGVLEHDLHHLVVRLLVRPVPLELQKHLLPGDGDRPGLDDPLHRAAVGRLAGPAGGVLDRVHLVPRLQRLDGRERQAYLRPQGRDHELLPPGLLDCGDELLVLP